MPFLTIITPAYNRADLLPRCFESLQRQTNKNFQWILVDDGSSDNTEEVAVGFKNANKEFEYDFIKKENGGKHTALNAAADTIRGDYVLILDSDDYLTDDAVETVKNGWSKYSDDNRIGIVTFLKGASIDKPNCIALDENVPVDIMRYKRKCILSSDCCEVVRVELYKKYSFPVFEGEKFIAECALWNRVSMTHKCVYINKVIYICEYLEGGLSKSGRAMRIRNPLGGMYTSRLRMAKKNYFKQRIKYGILYVCYGFFAGMKPIDMVKENDYKVLTWVCMLPGMLIYLLWRNN